MILADKIIEQRKKNGWSQEELADKLGVSRQSVSKWESAGSVPDLQRIIQLAELFGVSTDYLLKDDMVMEETVSYAETGYDSGEPIRRVSMEEANDFLNIKKQGAPIVANGVAMCIFSPVILIILVTMADEGICGISEGFATAVGCVILFALIAIAVFKFITFGMKESHMEHLEKENFETEYGVSGMVKEKTRDFEPVFSKGIAIGVVLCIVAVVPLIVVGAMKAPDYICGIFTGIMLTLIALGVNIIVRVSIVKGSYDTLLQEGEYSKKEKHIKGKTEPLTSAYWSLVTAGYLAWSFITFRWDFTWIVWPIAGVFYAALAGVLKYFVTSKEN